jgi:hypothetical protein
MAGGQLNRTCGEGQSFGRDGPARLSRRLVVAGSLGSLFANLWSGLAAAGRLRRPSAGRPCRAGEAAWDEAMAALRSAEAAVRAVEGAMRGYRLDEEAAVLPAFEAAVGALSDAVRRVIGTGAPDVAGLAVKVELLFAHAVEPGAVDPACVEAVREDLRRLAGGS